MVVEEHPDEQLLTKIAFQKARLGNELVVVGDGVAALDDLWARGPYADRDARDLPARSFEVDLVPPVEGDVDVQSAGQDLRLDRGFRLRHTINIGPEPFAASGVRGRRPPAPHPHSFARYFCKCASRK